MKKTLYILVFCLFSANLFSQSIEESYWARWDSIYSNYPISTMLAYEKEYADSIDAMPNSQRYYSRIDKYRFVAELVGDTRTLEEERELVMYYVFKLNVGNPAQLAPVLHKEVLFKVNGELMWLPIQKDLLPQLKKEFKKGDKIQLYCLYFNHHRADKKLFNIFLISEFREVKK